MELKKYLLEREYPKDADKCLNLCLLCSSSADGSKHRFTMALHVPWLHKCEREHREAINPIQPWTLWHLSFCPGLGGFCARSPPLGGQCRSLSRSSPFSLSLSFFLLLYDSISQLIWVIEIRGSIRKFVAANMRLDWMQNAGLKKQQGCQVCRFYN